MKTRREFLHTALSSFGLVTFASLIGNKNALASESFAHEKNNTHESITKQTVIAMGTFVSFTASQVSSAHAKEAFHKAIIEMARLEKIFSRHDENSALSLLNKEAKLDFAPQELIHVLNQSFEIARNTKDIYNPAVLPLLNLYEKYQDSENFVKEIPHKEIAEAQELIKLSQVKITKHSLKFNQEGMSITLDSLAKGYIIDKVSEILSKENVNNHIINAGGDIIARGRKSLNEAWIIGIEDPRHIGNPNKVLTSFALENAAIATSGAYQRFYDKEMQRHHIINPQSALSPKIFSVTCKAQSAMLADAYSTVNSLTANSLYNMYLV